MLYVLFRSLSCLSVRHSFATIEHYTPYTKRYVTFDALTINGLKLSRVKITKIDRIEFGIDEIMHN